MRKLAMMLTLILVLGAGWPAQGKTPYLNEEELKAEARRGFEEILDIWRAGDFGALYERTVPTGRQTKEGFAAKLAAAPLRPACCWEKMQDVKVTVHDESRVTVRARVGFEGGGATEFKTKSIRLEKNDAVWRIHQGEILSLAGGKKKGRRGKQTGGSYYR